MKKPLRSFFGSRHLRTPHGQASPRLQRGFFLALLAAFSTLNSPAPAATGTWSGTTTGIWDTSATNWSGVTGTPWDATNGAANRAIFATGSLNNTVSGTVFTNGVTFNANGTIGGGTLTLAGSGPILNAANAITGTLNADLAGTAGLTKTGAGTITIQNTLKAFTGGLNVDQGTLLLDLGTATTGVVASTNDVDFGGGTLTLRGKNSGASSQTLGALTLSAGSSALVLNPNNGTGTTLTMGSTWTANDTATLLIDLSSTSTGTRTLTSSPALTNDIVGGQFMVKDATATGFATVTGGNVVRYTGSTVITGSLATDTVATTNYSAGAGSVLAGPSSTQTVNSLEVTGNGLAASGGTKTLVVESGGILFSQPSAYSTIASSVSLTSGTGELDVYTLPSGDSRISGVIKDNGTTAVSLVKWGPGAIFLSGSDTYSGDTVINSGSIKAANIPSGPGKGDLVINTGGNYILGFNTTGGTRTINGLSNDTVVGGTVSNGTYVGTQSNAFLNLGNGDATAAFSGSIVFGSIIKSGTGTQTFAGTNTYTGTTAITAGSLQVGSAGVGTTGTGMVTTQSGAAILGTGTVQGSTFTAQSGSTVQAGDGIAATDYGTLTFKPASGSGVFDFQSGSNTMLGLNPGGTGDLLSFNGLSSGTLNFNGNLQVGTSGAYVPTSVVTFNLLDWTNIGTATFDSRYSAGSYAGYLLGNGDDNLGFDLPDISSSGYGWDISQFTTNGTISTIAIPETRAGILTISTVGLLLTRRRRNAPAGR